MDVRIGFHVSISGSISCAVDNAVRTGCTAFQIFTRNPRGWKAKSIDGIEVDKFKQKLVQSSISQQSVAVHMPYLPNLSAPDGDTYIKSVNALEEEILRCSLLDIPYLVIHLGSHMGAGSNRGIEQLIKSINTSLDHFRSTKRSTPIILLENSAGQKNSIGSRFEELTLILDKLGTSNFGVCFDTCHAFAAGYDLTTRESVDNVLDIFDNTIGFKNLKLIHLNDSKGDINSCLDRHEHVGLGKIGPAGFTHFLRRKEVSAIPMIMETPIDARRGDKENLEMVLSILHGSEVHVR